MSLESRLLVSCAILVGAPMSQALSADYNPPISPEYDSPMLVEDAPEWVPVEIGSGWYLRGDISYNFGESIYDFTLLGQKVKKRSVGGGVGFGYHLNDSLRVDATVSYLGNNEFQLRGSLEQWNATHELWNGMVNAYYDLGTIVGFTPYIGAGVGLTYSSYKANIQSPSRATYTVLEDRQYNFAYGLMAGASYKVTDNASIDVGYQFLHTPNMRYLDLDSVTFKKGNLQHQIKVGLRYDLW